MTTPWRLVLRGALRGLGLGAALLGALTVILSVPQHVLDWDDDGGAPAAAVTAAHGKSQTIIDHHAVGHECAGHCAAHVLGEAPQTPVSPAAISAPVAWQGSLSNGLALLHGFSLERPPRG